jgi:hypothetical protein
MAKHEFEMVRRGAQHAHYIHMHDKRQRVPGEPCKIPTAWATSQLTHGSALLWLALTAADDNEDEETTTTARSRATAPGELNMPCPWLVNTG